MSGADNHSSLGFWFLLLSICLAGCEYDTLPHEPVADFSGQKGSVMDIDSNTYQTIGIGKQIWMAENLAVTRLNDGSGLPLIYGDSAWARYNKPAFCIYKSLPDYKEIFGLLYNYHAVNSGQLCPNGWHVPSVSEWSELMKFAGGRDKAGGKLKLMDSPLWTGANYGFEEHYEFNGLPGGYRRNMMSSMRFENIGTAGYWWSKDSCDYFHAYAVSMKGENTSLSTTSYRKVYGLSIRCIKDKL